MGAMLNGMAVHGGVHPYGGTFLVFSDYMRGAVRLSAIMHAPVVFVWTHDSVGVGEDGPTHQPIEHALALRAMPGLTVIRPADANETAAAWRYALTHRDEPVALLLSRQNLTVMAGTEQHDQLAQGAYVLADAENGQPDVILIGDRLRGQRGDGGARTACGPGDPGPRRQHAELGAVRRAG